MAEVYPPLTGPSCRSFQMWDRQTRKEKCAFTSLFIGRPLSFHWINSPILLVSSMSQPGPSDFKQLPCLHGFQVWGSTSLRPSVILSSELLAVSCVGREFHQSLKTGHTQPSPVVYFLSIQSWITLEFFVSMVECKMLCYRTLFITSHPTWQELSDHLLRTSGFAPC